MIETNNVNDLIGAPVHGADEAKIGSVGQVFVDPDSQKPLWITVKTGLFGSSESFIPVEEASFDRHVVTVPFDKSYIKDAPRVAKDGDLSEEEQDALYAYYYPAKKGTDEIGNRDDHSTDAVSGRSDDTDSAIDGDQRKAPVAEGGAAAADEHNETGSQASAHAVGGRHAASTTSERHNENDERESAATGGMVRSEERLNVRTEQVPTERVRLRKHVVTEMKSVTVPVEREEFFVSHEPAADGGARPSASDAERPDTDSRPQ